MPKILGIDLGTTNSVVAVMEGDQPKVLVNSAGILIFKPILDVTIDDLRFIYAVNVEAVWDLCSRIGRAMPAGGAIVNLSSSAGQQLQAAAIFAAPTFEFTPV